MKSKHALSRLCELIDSDDKKLFRFRWNDGKRDRYIGIDHFERDINVQNASDVPAALREIAAEFQTEIERLIARTERKAVTA